MPKFLMVAMEKPGAFADVSPAEMQAIVQRYVAWSRAMRRAGQIVHSEKLKSDEGRAVRRRGSKIVVRDGPYSETKEVAGGFWLVKAKDYDAVVEIAKQSPHLDFGTLVISRVDDL